MGGGRMLVAHTESFRLDVRRRSDDFLHPLYPKNNHVDIGGLVDVIWQNSGEIVRVTGGELKGLIDMRDGIGGAGENILPAVPTELSGLPETPWNLGIAPNRNNSFGVPYYMRMWNLFAHTLMITFNEVHRQGFTLSGASGVNLFSDGTPAFDPLNPRQPAARFITISDEVRASWDNIAAIHLDASDLASGITPAQARGNNKNILRFLDLRHNTFVDEVQNLDNFAKGLISTLGVASRQASQMTRNQETLTGEMSRRRQSVSSVSLDEEMAAMVRFQHSYNASARMLSAIDEMLDVLINRVGIVGR